MSFQTNLSEALALRLSYTVTTGLSNISGTGEKPFLFFRNLTSKNNNIKLVNLRFGTDTTDTRTILRIYRNPSVSDNGTELGTDNKFIDTDSPLSDSDVFLKPTTTANGNLLNTFILPANSPSFNEKIEYMLGKGKRFLITAQNSIGGKKTHVDLDWIEIPL